MLERICAIIYEQGEKERYEKLFCRTYLIESKAPFHFTSKQNDNLYQFVGIPTTINSTPKV